MDPATAASLLDKYGIPIVVIGFLVAAVAGLFKLYRDAMSASNKVAVETLQQALDSEKAARQKAESRLESNTTALREATVGFAAALALMEKLADRDARDDERPRSPRR